MGLRQVLEQGLPLSVHPYQAIADQIGCNETEVIEQIRHWQDDKFIKRFGVVVKHHALGFVANAMCVWNIPDDLVDQVADQLSPRPEVTLCYQRRRQMPQWPYNLFCMIHGCDRELVKQQIAQINQQLNLKRFQHQVLFSSRQFKQQGGRYATV